MLHIKVKVLLVQGKLYFYRNQLHLHILLPSYSVIRKKGDVECSNYNKFSQKLSLLALKCKVLKINIKLHTLLYNIAIHTVWQSFFKPSSRYVKKTTTSRRSSLLRSKT